MTQSSYEAWLKRGREHQEKGRAIDAMLCFRRARREDSRNADALFHLGETLWQLDHKPEAIAAWREAVIVDTAHKASNIALAEGLLAVGDAAGARDAAHAAHAIAPKNRRAILIRATARMMLGEDKPDLPAIGAALEGNARLLATPTIAGPLAHALDRAPPSVGTAELLTRLVRNDPALTGAPPLLLALALENAVRTDAAPSLLASTIEAALQRDYASSDHDALRRIARVTSAVDASAGAALAERYAALCARAFAPPVPLLWPRRTAGDRVRVVVLLAPMPPGEAVRQVLTALAQLPRAEFAIAAATVGGASHEMLAAARETTEEVAELPAIPDPSVAKSIARRDADVLIDLAGLDAAAGPLDAARPARQIWTVDMPHRNLAPLGDRCFADGGALAGSLRSLGASHASADDCRIDGGTLASSWEEAVRSHQQKDFDAARNAYNRILELQPGYAPAHHLRGVIERELGNLDEARADFADAVAIAPAYLEARLASARAATEAHQPEAAVSLCEQGLASDPTQAALWRALGHAQLRLRAGSDAAAAFERALAIDPNDAETHYNHGVALQMSHELRRAARAYQRALSIDPALLAADFNLGVLFQEKGETAAAIAAYRNVLRSNPRYAAAYKNLGEVLLGEGKIDAWLANFERFEANCPEALPLAVQGLEAWQFLGDYARLERYLGGLAREAYRADDELQLVDCLEELLFLLLYFDLDTEMLLRFAQTYDASAKRVYGEILPRPEARKQGKIRVGYLSADLRNHVMGKMMWQAVLHHDRSRFELHFYSLSSAGDEWTERYKGVADGFADISTLTEREAALRIARDDLDILVDLSTHTKGSKPGILAFKPARVQITHVASSGPVGLGAVDFKLTDRYADVPENQAFMKERLLAMEGCVYPYRHIVPASEHPFRRETLGIAAETIVIGAFVNALKLSRRCLGLWREVLERIPRAKLALSPVNAAVRVSYLRLTEATGIAADRLVFLPQGRNDAENQARYELVDFVLDTMPYGGVNGTLEALDMGVPVVTLAGRRHGERTSYSILANLGVVDTVAQSGPDYVAIAVRLADDPAFMREVRDAIRRGLAGSPLTDMARHTQNLEAAYIAALRELSPGSLTAPSTHDG